ncbi:4456_t:CDS:1 [Acaulospora colombiana]|uniref:4456_t:CDS:1 n=1 Tax=Acaulospora colombiana TaxID=27376 RepID=A0ACA9KET5_9GLOM|nr:4456_t:CDS:1 [Acaulospora colombiana]
MDTSHDEISLTRASSLVDYAGEKIHAFPYKDVPTSWRRFYTDAALLKSVCEIFLAIGAKDDNLWKQVIGTLDMTLIMTGAPGDGRREMVFKLIEETEKILKGPDHCSIIISSPKPVISLKRAIDNDGDSSQDLIDKSDAKRIKSGSTENDTDARAIPIISNPLQKVAQPSLTTFKSHVTSFDPTPFIITSSISHWPALSTRPWNTNYLVNTIGKERLVPVEIGAKYTDENWTQKIVNFGEFVERWIKNSDCENVAYLAQHDLFTQVPRLRDDVVTPDYCFVDTNPLVINLSHGDDDEHPRNIRYTPPQDVITNAWFGPKGTISPMHTDPYHNLLAQVVGRKYIRLYSPSETSKVYPFEKDGFLNNTSQVGSACLAL